MHVELRGANCILRIASCGLLPVDCFRRIALCELLPVYQWTASSGLHYANCFLRITSYGLLIQIFFSLYLVLNSCGLLPADCFLRIASCGLLPSVRCLRIASFGLLPSDCFLRICFPRIAPCNLHHFKLCENRIVWIPSCEMCCVNLYREDCIVFILLFRLICTDTK